MLRRLRNISGFTMMELLGAIAVMSVLFAVGMVSVAGIQTNLKMNELDTTAQQLYDQAQNRSRSLTAAGHLEDLAQAIPDTQKIAAVPSDFDAAASPVAWGGLSARYTAKGDAACDTYLITPEAASITTQSLTGFYLIELSAATGEVYGVFYADEPFTYADIEALPARDRASRSAAKIGYHGGGTMNAAGGSGGTIDALSIAAVNGNELYLKVTNGSKGFGAIDAQQLTLTLTITGSDLNGQTAVSTETLVGGVDFTIAPAADELDIVLDSLRDGMSFRDLVAGSDIAPGCDITVGLTAEYRGRDYTSTSVACNSLYGAYDAVTATVSVSTLRHLRNLDADYGTFIGREGACGKIAQTADIDFDGAGWPAESVSVQSLDAGKAYNPLARVTARWTPVGVPAAAAGATYDGAGHRIADVEVVGTGDDTGLFSTCAMNISNLTLASPRVSATGGATATLVGRMTGGSVTDVTVTDASVSSSGSATGGLVGTAAGGVTLTRCGLHFDRQDADGNYDLSRAVTGTDRTGGVVGLAQDASLVDCYAAIPVSGTSYVGGAIGYLGAGGVTGGYASGTVRADETAGGFVGAADAAVVDAFATGDVFCDYRAGGFVGSANVAGQQRDRSYGHVMKLDGSTDTSGAGHDPFAGARVSDSAFGDCAFLQMHGYNEGYPDWSDTVNRPQGMSFEDASAVTHLSTEKTHATSVDLRGGEFPFAYDAALDAYWGDWPRTVFVEFRNYPGDATAEVFQSYRLLRGGVPDYTGPTPGLLPAPSDSSTWRFTGWNDSFGPIDADTVYVAQYESVELDAVGGQMFSRDDYPLWDFLFKRYPSGYVSASTNLNSEAHAGPDIGGTADAINAWMSQQMGVSSDTFSWRIFLASGAIFDPDSPNQGALYNNLSAYENKLKIFVGGKAEYVGQTVPVTVYDLGRTNRGLPGTMQGTIKVTTGKTGNTTYLVYDGSSFVASTGWY